jgi:lipid A 3-O-deacylase
MPRKYLAILILVLLPFAARGAESQAPASSSVNSPPAATTFTQPDLLSFGLGYIDFDKDQLRVRSTDFRLEYRWGDALYATHNDWFKFGIDPLVGGDASTRGQFYGFGGFAFDFLFWKHLVFTESEAVGLFDSGNVSEAKPLGSFIEFRSQVELGYRFDNDVRLTAQISHISNAGLTNRNPGEEIAGGYLHVPVGMIFGN